MGPNNLADLICLISRVVIFKNVTNAGRDRTRKAGL